MQVHSIEGNVQKLDGGAMYGNCPKAVWERWSKPDHHNRITLACRAMLVVDGDKTVLFEAGIGAFFEPKLRERYGVTEDRHVLLDSLRAVGLSDRDIDVVVLSHLHFDHAGGLLTAYRSGEEPELLFPRARFLVGKTAWERALAPHLRDKASFIPRLVEQLASSGRLELVDGEHAASLAQERYRFTYSSGHTPGLMHAVVATAHGSVTFASDLVPGVPWVHLPITMGYDRSPESVIDEKAVMLDRVEREAGWLFFTHDPDVAVAKVSRDAFGKMAANDASREVHWV